MEVEPKQFTLADLPPRVKGPYLNNRPKMNIDTNLYKVTFDKSVNIGIYSVKFNPAIHYDNRKLRVDLLNRANSQIKESLGQYVINGSTVYACYKSGVTKDIVNVKVSDAGTEYQLTFEKKEIGPP